MKLYRVALQESGAVAGGQVLVGGEQEVQRGQLSILAPPDQRAQQRLARLVVTRQQAGAGHGCERNRHQRFRVVGQAMLGVGVCPGPVKDVFAVGVLLEVQRAAGCQGVTLPERQKVGHPAGGRGGAAAVVQCRQVFVPHEGRGMGLGGQQGVPGDDGDLPRRIKHPNAIIVRIPFGRPGCTATRGFPVIVSGH
jgi:hypothetical protein